MASIPLFIRLFTQSLVLAILLIFCLDGQRAEASLGSMVSSLFTNTSQAADISINIPPVRTVSSQNVALLIATVNTENPTSTMPTDAIDLNIVSNSALMPDAGPLGTIADIEESDAGTDTISVYTVRSGDTIQKIAKMFGVSVNTIIWGNDLKGAKDIKIGQDLVILPVSGIQYTIKKGDTVASIAKKYGGDPDEIISFNNLDRNQKLVAGDEIIIPNGEIRAVPSINTKIHVISTLIKTYINEAIDSFSYYIHPILHGRVTQGLHGKNGVDIAPDCHCSGKEALLAAAAGNVIVAKAGGWNGGYGNYVVISHPNGTQTLYGHMYSVSVHSGDQVEQGQQIGILGSSGNSTGPHVHFEIRGATNPFNQLGSF